jgi:mannose-6-phosphate isomerase-like protein (cupin superfamily)
MDVVQLEKSPVVDTPHKVDVRKLYDTQNAVTVHITLQPGESLKKHITPVDVFFYVLEGKGIVEIGEEKNEVDKDTLIDSPARIPHCWYNESTETLRFLVVKVPRPTIETKLL